jgi:hypothetical protein
MIETLFIIFCILLFLVLIALYLRRYARRYQNNTPFLTPVSDGKRVVPFGVMQVRYLAEHQSERSDDKQSSESSEND